MDWMEAKMGTAIISIGVAIPQTKISQENCAMFMADLMPFTAIEKQRLYAIYKGTGILQRYTVLKDYNREPAEYNFFPKDKLANFPSTARRMQVYQVEALPLALRAIADCLREFPPSISDDITHLITVSCTGMYAPGLDIEIAQRLNFRPDVQRTAINFMGCYAVVNALKVANTICQANSKAKVLVVSVELCTLHVQKSKKLEDIVASAIFADGASAALLQAKPQSPKCLMLESFHCDLIPQTNEEMAWRIGDSGFNIVLTSYVPQAIKSSIAVFVERFLQATNISLASVNKYAIPLSLTNISAFLPLFLSNLFLSIFPQK